MKNVIETKRKRAVGYIRVSTVMQKEEGHSLQSQVQQIENFTKGHNYELTEIYSDEGISGKNIKNRPGIQKLIDDAKQDKFDLVVIWKLTRLGRSMKDVLNIAELLNANNVGLHSVSEAFDISTSTGVMLLGLLANFAQFEREIW